MKNRLALLLMIVVFKPLFGQTPGCLEGAFFDTVFESSLQPMPFTLKSMSATLPSSVDNSTEIYMPPVFNQWQSSSCVHCAEVAYTFTYEINRFRNVPAGTLWTSNNEQQRINLYHPFFTYNFVNKGNGNNGTAFGSAFRIIAEDGCPSYNDYFDPILLTSFNPNSNQLPFRRWMSGRDKYINASENRSEHQQGNSFDYYSIPWRTTYSSLDSLKRWLSNHGTGDTIGGLAVISVRMGYDALGHPLFNWDTIQTGPETGKKILSQWGGGWHALTIVGYNDDICVSGNYTTPGPDTPLSQCEKGAFKAVNSWGIYEQSTNLGYIWIPYRLVANIDYYYRRAYTCVISETPQKTVFLSAEIKHPKRGKVNLYVGQGNNALSPIPTTNSVNRSSFYIFSNNISENGGLLPMNGNDQNPAPIDLALNFGEKFDPASCGKYFLQVEDSYQGPGYSPDEAYVTNYRLKDFRWNEEFELDSGLDTVHIQNGNTTTLAINYHLLPFQNAISSSFTMSTDRVARRIVEVTGGTFTIDDGVSLDMYGTDDYDCRLLIGSSASLAIGDHATVTAKRGRCKILVEGGLHGVIVFQLDDVDTLGHQECQVGASHCGRFLGLHIGSERYEQRVEQRVVVVLILVILRPLVRHAGKERLDGLNEGGQVVAFQEIVKSHL